jgi:hypothetical protein
MAWTKLSEAKPSQTWWGEVKRSQTRLGLVINGLEVADMAGDRFERSCTKY